MATLRSSLPSRLRQLFSSEGSFGPSLQLESEPPPKIKAFIDKVIQSPLQDIAIPLSGFRWEYNKGNFHHWRPLFHHFDTYFKEYLSNRNDLLLSDTIVEDDSPFPKHAVLQILRVMQIILENCHNKSSFDGLEHFKLLLASTDPEVLLATLETLSALVKIHPSKLHVSGKMIGLGSINSCLLSLAQGWGSKEEGLGLYSCVVANEKSQEEGLSLFPPDMQDKDEKSQSRLGSTLYFELHGVSPQRSGESSSSDLKSVSSTVIHMPDLHLRKEDDILLLKQCIEHYNVPPEQRFSLLTRIRFAHAFRSPRSGRLYSRICLLAFIVLVQSNDANDELVSFFANEPEYTNELIKIVRSEEAVSGTIRTLAMLALGAQLAAYSSSHDRARMLSGSSINFAGGNRMILLNVLQKAILSLKNSSDPSSLAFVEALLQFYLLHVISTSSSGSIIRGSGMVPTFLPLLEDSDPAHMHLVCYAVKTLQKLMDYSNAAVTLFKDLGGVDLLAHRLQIEVQRVIGMESSDENLMIIGESSVASDDHLYAQKRLIRALLKALGSATYAPANTSRSQSSQDSSLPSTLALIFRNVGKFGGDIYCSAVTVMSEVLHKDPTCFPALHEMGLPDAFLSSVVGGILPSSKALTCVPSGLGAICLNAKGLEAVKEVSALRFLVDVFTSKKYVVAMNEAIVQLANGAEELLRHVSSLRSTGVDIIIEIINKMASLGEGGASGSSEMVNDSSAMEMDSGDRGSGSGSESHSSLVSGTDAAGEGVTHEQFINLSVFHVMVLVHRTMENSETCRLFVEKSGIDALLKLLLRPSIAQSSEGMAIALHSTMVFKGFTQHHSAPLARAFCSFLRDHLKKALTGFSVVSGSFLLDPKKKPDHGVFSSLFLVEFLLFLAASKENRWVSALLTEFGGDSKDVLEDIGRVHREILWQIALLEDAKVEIQEDGPVSASDTQQASTSSENDEQRVTSFRQLLDPLLRRRMSGWSVESQFFDLINLYRDLGRASGIQHRSTSDSSSLRLGSSQQSHRSGGSDTGSAIKREEDKQRNYYSSCCDTVRSLALHIMHLFQELGKAMLLPSRRRDDAVNISPSSKSVVSTFASIALEHMNFGGHMSPSGSEASVSSKCRYFGKVVDFIDGILMDRHDACNAVLLNCLYGQGVIQSVLTTFEATSQLLFTVPASPMETDDRNLKQERKDEPEHSWLYGPLASYGKLMDHLVTSSYILSPFTKHLLVQPISSGDIPFPRDAETFVKILQSMVLKAVLPVWTHPQFVECSYDFITSIISIVRHIYSGVEVKNSSGGSSSRLTGPPPNETAISTIVEMGFSRSRAEEALRQVGANSVELAMEWLFSHPEEAQEDDELARALAMSLGNSGADSKEEAVHENNRQFEEEMTQLPPIDELLLTCVKLLKSKESLAFPVRDLLMTMCSQNDGQYRPNVISFIIDQIKQCTSVTDRGNSSMLSALFHVLALILHEDAPSRETCLKNGLVELVSDLLWQWDVGSPDELKEIVPRWVTAAFLALDRLLQVDQKLNSEVVELLKKNSGSSQQTSIVLNEDKQHKPQESLQQHVDIEQQKRLILVACNCVKKQLSSETMHAVLQLCATLTRTHSVAVSFLEAGGLPLLLNLPTSSLFPGFDNIAATIIRHILEDPQTLQQAMESEIRHSIVTATNRHSSGRLTVRNFLVNLTSVISRDPVVFMRAAQSVCQVEMVGDRPYVVLLKDREKDRSKEKEKEKASEKDKQVTAEAKPAGALSSASLGGGQGKLQESKSFKAHRKPPHSFVNVIELLLDTVLMFEPPTKDDSLPGTAGTQSTSDMDVDVASRKGKGKAIVCESVENESESQDPSASLAKVVFVLKLLTEILVTYSASIHVLLRKDAEVSSCRGLAQRSPSVYGSGGVFHHILHKFVPYARSAKKEKKLDGDWKHKLATRASQFLVAACVRSAEARKRIFTEINAVFTEFVESADGFIFPGNEMQAFIDLINDVLGARSPTGSYISAEASATFIDVGLVRSLTRTLQVLDLDQPDSSRVVTGLIKALELVTKEHVHSADGHAGKGDNSAKPSDLNEGTDNSANGVQTMEAASQENDNSIVAVRTDSFSAGHTYGGSEAVTDYMEHDQDLDGGFPPNEDDYMHDAAEDGRGLDNGIDTVGIRFEIQPDGQQNLDEDDDEDMSGDDGDDDEEDEEDDEHNELEEDEDHHLPNPDTDQDDHEMDEDDFDEEVLEEDEEEDEDDEDRLILRLEEGINGINVLDHIEVFGRDNHFANETLMPVELFGSRRQGRSTSIYNLLGRSDTAVPSQHPLLVESHPSVSAPSRASENTSDLIFSDRNIESASSRLDTIFRSARNGRQGHRFNLWLDDNEQGGGSSSSAIPQGLEEFLVSQLRRPNVEKPSDQIKNAGGEPERKSDASQLQVSEASIRTETTVEGDANNQSHYVPAPSTTMDRSIPESGSEPNPPLQATDGSSTQSQSVEMQFEHNDAAVRDVEAVSQESGGSGATLGESLRSLDVEIGSADGHDDGGDRQGSADRMPLGEPVGTRTRRSTVSFGSSTPVGARETALHSVSEVAESPGQEAEQGVQGDGQQTHGDAESGSIDPAFLEALPEELRAEVLSAQQSQAAQPANTEQQNTGDIDPEFLAALPPDIRAEVLAQQQAQRLHQSQELEGQPVEMDTVSIIATFPSDLREEVLLTSSDAVLANLTPALVAEANMLRERFAHRYHSRTLFGMYPRSRRGESSRRGEGSSLDRAVGGTASRRSIGSKLLEADGAPLVDTDALKGMIRLLRVVQPIYKGQFQRLLLNLCAHSETRTALVKILMEMLMLDKQKPGNLPNDAEPPYRLYACQSHVMYSRPQFVDGVPPLVSRRVLETLTYLARNHPYVAKILLELSLPQRLHHDAGSSDQARGKALMTEDKDTGKSSNEEGVQSIALLLGLLNQPLYLRSIAHLEQLLNLLDVIIDNAGSKSNSSSKPRLSAQEQQPGTDVTSTDVEMNTDSGAISSSEVNAASKVDESTKPSTSGVNELHDAMTILLILPQADLRLLCSLLATEGLSDNAYTLVAEVLKKLVAITPPHCHLFITELASSVQKLSHSAMRELHSFGEAEASLLHSTSSDGAAILRVLQALSSLVSSMSEKGEQQNIPAKENNSALSLVREINSALEPLWLELSSCISKIEGYSDSAFELPSSSLGVRSKPSTATPPLPAGTQNVLPYIESFFVTCEKIHSAQPGAVPELTVAAVPEIDDASTSAGKQQVSTPTSKVDEKHVAFVKFTEKHRKLLNAFIRQNSGLLEKSFSLMLKVPRFIDFDNKRAHFRSKIKHQHDHHHSPLRISVRRAYILEDSYNQLRMRSTQELKGRLTVHFQGEEGIDAGGLTREWYQSLSRVIFDRGALLFTTVGNDSTFQPNPNSVYQTEHLSYFKFVGRVVGKALFDGQLLDVHFTRSFYKHILGAKVTYHDIEAIDPDYYKNLKWMLENDISDVLDLTFSIDADEEKLILYERNEVTDYELIPGGRNIKVTEENKHQYVDLVAEHRLTTAIRPQINAFLEGFNELIPRELISIFNDKELELLISGLPDIDLDDMRANTEYSGYSPGSPVIQWFWEVVQGLSKEDKARLLQFVTGTSKVPLEGFSALQGISGSQKFQIHKAYGSPDHLPSAHTCFNQLDLPEYPSKEHLQERLLLAIHEANEGFGFG